MKLFRGKTNCPRCVGSYDPYNCEGNGRHLSKLTGLYLTRRKEYANDYGILYVISLPVKQLGKIKHYQYNFNLETEEQNFKEQNKDTDPDKSFTDYLLQQGYDTVELCNYNEVIVINPQLASEIDDKMIRYSDIRKGLATL